MLKHLIKRTIDDRIAICEMSLAEAQVPQTWRNANTCAIPKSGKNPSKVAMGKLLEIILKQRFSYFLQTNEFLTEQLQYRSSKRCVSEQTTGKISGSRYLKYMEKNYPLLRQLGSREHDMTSS